MSILDQQYACDSSVDYMTRIHTRSEVNRKPNIQMCIHLHPFVCTLSFYIHLYTYINHYSYAHMSCQN